MVVTRPLHTGQALAHFHALRAVRTIARVHVWGRSQEHAAQLVAAIEQVWEGLDAPSLMQ